MVDSRFLPGSPTPEFVPKELLSWQDFGQKLHENKRNWTETRREGDAHPLDPPLMPVQESSEQVQMIYMS